MSKFQLISASELKKMLEQRNLWSRIQSGKYLAKEQTIALAKMAPDATSYILSYYDEHLNYICTIHMIKAKSGEVLHEHVKDASIEGIRYKAIEELHS